MSKSVIKSVALVVSLVILIAFCFPVFAGEQYSFPKFPSCVDYTYPGDNAHYESGPHQIAGGSVYEGRDDVYSLPDGNFLQCFCPSDGINGIQTNWLRKESGMWAGKDWGLGDFNYATENSTFICKGQTPTPVITPPVPTPTEEPKPTTGASNSSSVDHNSAGVYFGPRCTATLPKKPSFSFTRLNSTAVRINWNQENDENTTGWMLLWGYEKYSLPYGSGPDKLPKEAREFTIGALAPSTPIWVQLFRWNGDSCLSFSDTIDP